MLAFLLMLAHAAPMPLQGLYQFRGHLDPLSRTTFETLNPRRPEDVERWKKLREQGADCLPAGPLVRCVSHRPPSEISTESLRRIVLKNQNLKIEMLAVTASPGVLHKGDSVIEWQIYQGGRSSGGSFEKYRLFEMRGGLQKIAIPSGAEEIWFHLESPQRFRRYDSVVVTESESRWHSDAVEVLLER